MSFGALSPRDRRVLGFGAAVMLAILVVGRGVPVLIAYSRDKRRSATEAVAKAEHAEWLVRNARALERALTRTRRQLAQYDSALVEGDAPSTASASLAELISDAVGETEARLGSIRLNADSTARAGELVHVVAHASITGDLSSIASVLQSLEQGPRLVAISELSLAATQPSVTHDQVEQLQAELVVEGVFRPAPTERVR